MKTNITILAVLLSLSSFTIHADNPPAAPKGMVYVPAGTFIMGSDIGDADESPKHITRTDEFFIDEYEVSNADYKKANPDFSFREGRANFPVRVTWEQAQAYAKSLGKRLPTEKEWEKAARGTDGRMFPWGNTYDPTFVQYDSQQGIGQTIANPKSPYGCYDMAGGAMEWVSDWYAAYPGNEIASPQYGTRYKVLKGGTTFNDIPHMRCAHRFYLPKDDSNNYMTGFRCAKDVK